MKRIQMLNIIRDENNQITDLVEGAGGHIHPAAITMIELSCADEKTAHALLHIESGASVAVSCKTGESLAADLDTVQANIVQVAQSQTGLKITETNVTIYVVKAAITHITTDPNLPRVAILHTISGRMVYLRVNEALHLLTVDSRPESQHRDADD